MIVGAIAETAALTWPLAMTLASVAVADRWRSIRRREALNRALHELRRPLQALVLASGAAGPGSSAGGGHAGLALEALADLDREVNGARTGPRMRVVDGYRLAAETAARWNVREPPGGERIKLVWRAGEAEMICDPGRVSRALDNLIANALEHGRSPVRLEASARGGRVRLLVADGADAAGTAEPAPAHGRSESVGRVRSSWPEGAQRHRGRGLRIVARIAAEHGGRFALCRHEAGASAVLELPLL